MSRLSGYRVAVVATDGFEESELLEPIAALKEAGADVKVVAPKAGKIQGFVHDKKGRRVKVDQTIEEARPDDFEAVQLPGGCLNADALRVVPEVQRFLREMQQADKPIAAICHAPWELISAGLIGGRTLTSYHTIQDDIRNAGGISADSSNARVRFRAERDRSLEDAAVLREEMLTGHKSSVLMWS